VTEHSSFSCSFSDDDPYADVDLSDVDVDASLQQILAPRGRAVGQCPDCGAFRTDGKPPTMHRRHCLRNLTRRDDTT